MNQREAFRETLDIALANDMDLIEMDQTEVSYLHLASMWEHIQADPNMSETKLGRWLGWAQCAVVAADIGVTLEDMKAVNKRWAD
jgi:hypothetical protein